MAQSGHLIKDGSTNNASNPVYVKSDGTLADANISIAVSSHSATTSVTFSKVPKLLLINTTSGTSLAINYSSITTSSTSPTYIAMVSSVQYYVYVSSNRLTLYWCHSQGSSMTGRSFIAVY